MALNMLKLFNTLTGKKEEFKPIESGEVGLYNCGPTVYNFAHIGNLRAYVFTDILRRTLEWNGYKVKQVMNITDVGHLTSDADSGEDKMTKALLREGLPITLEAMKEVGEKYTKAFIEDLKKLNIELPSEMPRASDNIAEDIEIIKKLEEKGFAYRISDGIYFDTAKFSDYGKLGGVNKASLKEGARVEVNPEKRNPADFNLWKYNSELGFETDELGKGFPGWHIECSAMSRKYLGQPFDIHTGGVDHIGTHHNNEIAQSEAAFGVPLANYWLHNEHLNLGDEKMAKSGDNFITLETLKEKNIEPLALRYLFLTARYSSPLQFSWEALEGASVALRRLRDKVNYSDEPSNLSLENIESIKTNNKNNFSKYINDNLDTPFALNFIWEIARGILPKVEKRAILLEFDKILGLELDKVDVYEVPEDVQKLLNKRDIARTAKDFKLSDELREEIRKLGFEVKDTEKGQIVEKI